MTGITTLADELRQRIKERETAMKEGKPTTDKELPIGGKSRTQRAERDSIPQLLERIRAFPNGGNEKMLIRLDGRDIQLLKQLKLVSGIDMTHFIAFALDTFLKDNPGLKEHIKHSLLKEFK